ncbi:MAG: efflux RND transporter periplasmic adaptor subunit [Hydrogenophaga sp.]|nr:efflux RND transporter periplasmic adaptor subunit [Hydrogenophaga sp.]MBW0183857.1 efflux RND transporter periplasmic adaptor subunit [Hydrogenophaga sp.]
MVVTVVVALATVGASAWWFGKQQGMEQSFAAIGANTQTEGGPAAGATDPDQWSIAQGEDATRRHIQSGLKAGDIDPMTGRRILNYHDPMVPGKQFDAPAKSPFMDMMLVPRYAGNGAADANSITVSPRIQQNLGLRTAPVVQGALVSEITAVGSVAWNERDQALVSSRAMGYVEKLHVNAVLDRVAAGAPLAELYVPDWVAAQEEYLALARLSGAGTDTLKDAARQRMRQAGMEPAQIQQVVNSGQLQPRFTLRAPIAGVLTELAVRQGSTAMPGMVIARIQGTRTVWAEGEVPESQAALLQSRAPVKVTSPGAPGQNFEGRLQALLPQVNPATRTVRARLELANPGERLVPGMSVQMRFARSSADSTLMVPSDAVIHTGRRSVVMLATEGGRFSPVEVVTGLESGGQTAIVSGLQEGQRVVLSGQFLIDSEASLRGLEARLNQAPEEGAPRYRTDAVINAINGDTVNVTHPPIEALKWPQMTMDFKLPPRERQPRNLEGGDRLQIEFHMQDGDVPQITSIQRVAPEPSK